MFRAYLGPSSGGKIICTHQLVLIILFRWLSVVLDGLFQSNQYNRQSSKKNNKYQLLYTYSCTSWWWAYISPKHVQVGFSSYDSVNTCQFTRRNIREELNLQQYLCGRLKSVGSEWSGEMFLGIVCSFFVLPTIIHPTCIYHDTWN